MMTKQDQGFTIIELLVIIILIGAASVLFFVQKNNITIAARDQQRKTAINAMYYSLEEVYYPAHSYYPSTLDGAILPSVDPALFTDPNGIKLGGQTSNYRYEPTNCINDQCKSYILRSTLDNEADFIKDSKNH